MEEFRTHTEKFNLIFESPAEELARFKVFSERMAAFEIHNAEYALGKHGYTMGPNQFTHMTSEEFNAYTNQGKDKVLETPEEEAFHKSMPIFRDNPELRNLLELDGAEIGNFQTDLDWRNTPGVITPVKNQGQCGSCWAFGATGAIEGAYALYSGVTPTRLSTNSQFIDTQTGFNGFSEQNFISCDTAKSNGCDGGKSESAYLYAANIGGLPSEKTYPYTDGGGALNNACDTVASSTLVDATQLDRNKPYTNILKGDLNSLQAAVLIQPIEVSIQAGPSSAGEVSPWQSYSGGIVTLADGCGTELDHSVLLVGYHDDPLPGQSYWIVKNSWSSYWGLDGYIYIEKSLENACGILDGASFPNIGLATASPNPAMDAGPPTMSPTMPSTGVYTATKTLPDSAHLQSQYLDIFTITDGPPGGMIPEATEILSVEMYLNIDGITMMSDSFQRPTYMYVSPANPTTRAYWCAAAIGRNDTSGVYNIYVARLQTVLLAENTKSAFYIFTTGIVPNMNLPLSNNNLKMFYSQPLLNDVPVAMGFGLTVKGIGIRNLKWRVDTNYPTAMPTITPAPSQPVLTEPRNRILATVLHEYTSSPDCIISSTTAFFQQIRTYGLCERDPDSAQFGGLMWQMTIPGTPQVTNPNEPYIVPLYRNLYTDKDCIVLSNNDPPEPEEITVNTCVSDNILGMNLYHKITYNGAPSANVQPSFPPPVSSEQRVDQWLFKDKPSCLIRNMTQVVVMLL